jgi:uncharacterized repeat protein (TIGR01451 family)
MPRAIGRGGLILPVVLLVCAAVNVTSAAAGSLSGAALQATKTVAGSFVEGGAITYTVVVTNAGSTQADNPGNEFSDVLPGGVTLVSAAATSGTAVATVATNTVTWNGALGVGASVTITINATIKAGTAGTTISNQGAVFFDTDANNTNESSALSDDPGTGAANDPTSFQVASVIQVPALSEIGTAVFVLLLTLAAFMALRQRGT